MSRGCSRPESSSSESKLPIPRGIGISGKQTGRDIS
eukprot:gene8251-biopygen14576